MEKITEVVIAARWAKVERISERLVDLCEICVGMTLDHDTRRAVTLREDTS